MSWKFGKPIVRRDVWRGRPWVGTAAIVVQDDPALLAVYVPEGSELEVVVDDFFPIVHPWSGKRSWSGHGVLILSRPGDAHSVWVFWDGPRRDFGRWYVNFEAPPKRTALGYDTRDHELDLWSEDGRNWEWKDADKMEQRVAEGLYTAEEAEAIFAEGERVYAEVSAGRAWWSEAWADWTPPDDWPQPRLPAGWASASW
jgi:hypothetical protein